MRPLTLVMSAFGPFAGEERIDFTKLGDVGLYLVTGDTGAGKTTIFDAISYALYGITSGELRDGKMLRSKYASSDRLTYVELTFVEQGKVYTVKRMPDQKKAKKRGEGETTQKAEATLLYPDDRQPVSKIAEVDRAVKEIVGLDHKQFSQITMLAQGQFQKMLLSSTDEKQRIFRDIFATENYEKLQDDLKVIFLDKKRAYDARKEDIVRDIVSLECADMYGRKEELDTFQAKRQLVQREEFQALVTDLVDYDKLVADKYVEELKGIEDTLQELNARIGVAMERQKSVLEMQRVEKELELLKNALPEKEKQLQKAEENLQSVEVLNANAIRMEEKLKDYNQYSELYKEIENRKQRILQLEKQQEFKKEALIQCEQDKKKQDAIIEKYQDVEVRLLECEQQVKQLEERRQEVAGMMLDCVKGQQICQEYEKNKQECQAKTEGLERNSKLHAENERRFYNAQAGILAEKLAIGEPCPVCGSVDHPRPASKIEEILSKEQLDEETREIESLRKQCQLVSAEVVRLKEQLEQQSTFYKEKSIRIFGEENVNLECLEEEQTRLAIKVANAQDLLEQWRNGKKVFEQAKEEIPVLEERYKKFFEELQSVDKEKTACQIEKKSLLEQANGIKKGLKFENEEEAKKAIHEFRAEASLRMDEHKKATQNLQILNQKMSEWEGQKQSLQNLLSSQPLENLDDLLEQRDQILQRKQRKENEKNLVMARFRHNSLLKNRLYKNWCEFDVFEQEYLQVKMLSDTVNGELAGKDKVKLETYIQMSYFERVLAKANVRLLGMTGGQYELVRSAQADNQRSQSGLDINVYDYYTSSERSIKSLSGGESFMASLALALGLADEMQSTVGGIHIDTLFVDEGFGSLDDETLRRAMKELDKLTEGNRLVGVISHVPELKNWIDKQVTVMKVHHQGSNVSMVL
ncbi:MAG: SMC family ATPase [Lachnospiraceae bacterium]|nr:SMC family ATPase [Lachnospiraceae bacterium]